MVQKLRAAGATEVIQHGETIAAAGEYMKNVVMKEDTHGPGGDDVVKIALHPFDHEAIWEGNSTIVDELAYQLPPADEDDARALPVDAVICSVGGGGLMNGLVRGIERHRQRQGDKQKDIHILAAETEGTASLALAMSHKALVSLPKITSLATSLGCVRVSAQTLDYALSPPPGVAIHSVILSDADAARGVLRLVDDERLLVELACGVCVETAVGVVEKKPRGTKRRKRSSAGDEGYGDDRDDDARSSSRSSRNGSSTADGPSSASFADSAVASDEETEMIPPRQLSRLKQLVPDLTPESRVVIIVCGGSNVTIDMAWEWRKKLECGWV